MPRRKREGASNWSPHLHKTANGKGVGASISITLCSPWVSVTVAVHLGQAPPFAQQSIGGAEHALAEVNCQISRRRTSNVVMKMAIYTRSSFLHSFIFSHLQEVGKGGGGPHFPHSSCSQDRRKKGRGRKGRMLGIMLFYVWGHRARWRRSARSGGGHARGRRRGRSRQLRPPRAGRGPVQSVRH